MRTGKKAAQKELQYFFFSPEYIRKGLGRMLVEFAFSALKTDKVDVNEQNKNAVKFYEKPGFKTYETKFSYIVRINISHENSRVCSCCTGGP